MNCFIWKIQKNKNKNKLQCSQQCSIELAKIKTKLFKPTDEPALVQGGLDVGEQVDAGDLTLEHHQRGPAPFDVQEELHVDVVGPGPRAVAVHRQLVRLPFQRLCDAIMLVLRQFCCVFVEINFKRWSFTSLCLNKWISYKTHFFIKLYKVGNITVFYLN